MAIRLNIEEGHPNLFCDSKFWGDPDMPEDMEYPMVGGRPLTFICQVSCYDIAQMDPDGLLPHDGMLYFFADIDEILGYETDVHHPAGEWPKGYALVKFTKTVNMETFKSIILMDDEDKPLSQKAQPLKFSPCSDGFEGMRMLGDCPSEGRVTLIQLPLDPHRTLRFSIKATDLGFGNWKKATLSLEEK